MARTSPFPYAPLGTCITTRRVSPHAEFGIPRRSLPDRFPQGQHECLERPGAEPQGDCKPVDYDLFRHRTHPFIGRYVRGSGSQVRLLVPHHEGELATAPLAAAAPCRALAPAPGYTLTPRLTTMRRALPLQMVREWIGDSEDALVIHAGDWVPWRSPPPQPPGLAGLANMLPHAGLQQQPQPVATAHRRRAARRPLLRHHR